MNPVIKKLSINYPELFLLDEPYALDNTYLQGNVPLWSKLVDDHLSLNMDYSLLCEQIRDNLFAAPKNNITATQLREQLEAAILFAELLNHLYLENYLNVPREAKRFGSQRRAYLQILGRDIKEPSDSIDTDLSAWQWIKNWFIHLSLAQWIRNNIAESNLYRLLLARSRRFLEMIHVAGLGTKQFGQFITALNRFALPFFTWLGWIFFVPRLFLSLIILIKNTFFTSGMGDELIEIGWHARLKAQLSRRWFHLGNDLMMFTVGLLNCFLLVGALSPIGIYLSFSNFIYDVVLAVVNVSIELYRLNRLKNQYAQLEEQTLDVQRHQDYLKERMTFEGLRLGINVLSTIAIVLATILLLPFFASTPWIPLIGAALLVIISLVAFATTSFLEQYQPKDAIDEQDVPKFKERSQQMKFFTQNKEQSIPCPNDFPADTVTNR